MPDLKMRYPSTIFVTGDAISRFIKHVTPFIAVSLDCNDYDGNPVELKPEHIDVHLMPYDEKYVRFTGAPILVEITGYDYPQRLADINERLVEIKDVMSAAIRGFGGYYDPNGREVAVTFIPIPEGCWV